MKSQKFDFHLSSELESDSPLWRFSKSMPRLALLCLLIPASLLSGCSSSSDKPEPEAKEIPSAAKTKLTGSSEELFHNGKRLYLSGLYSVAKESFDSLVAQFPIGPYAEFAAIKSADCSFEAGDYAAAAQSYDEFMSSHPSSKNAAYVLLQLARSYQNANKGLGRDSSVLEKSRQAYERLLTQYPQSIYAPPAQQLRLEVLKLLSAQEEMVIDFYRRQDKLKAAEARKAQFDKNWAPLLTNANLVVPPTTQPDGQVGNKTDFNNRPLEPVKVIRAAWSDKKAVATAKLNVPTERPQNSDQPRSELFIEEVSCTAQAVFIQLSKTNASVDAYVKEHATLTPVDGTITLQLPNFQAAPRENNCFGSSDLNVDGDGKVTIKSSEAFEVIALNNPPRVGLVRAVHE